MEHMREYTINILKDLLDACREEYILLNTASENIKNDTLKEIFGKYSQKKYEYAVKLECEIKRLGGDLDNQKNPELKNPFQPGLNTDTGKLLRECVRRDSMAFKLYSSAIKEDILWEVIPLIAKQYFETKNIHDQIFNICNKTMETHSRAYVQTSAGQIVFH
jgi:uncharacterized protein (TIGR02284 family)